MLVITVCHYVKPGQVDAARKRIASNGDLMSRQPGFLFRHTGNPPGRPSEIITVTGWRGAGDRDGWNRVKSTLTYPADQSDPYERFEQYECEVFDARWAEGFATPD
jgi:hypothetical protein